MSSFQQILISGAFAAGIAVASVGLSAYDRLIDDPAVAHAARAEGKAAGVAEERRAWQELRDRAEIEKARKLAAAQERINAADQQLADYRASDRRRADAIGRDVEDLRESGLAGSPAEVVDRIGQFAGMGAQRIYLQTLDMTDLDHLELVAAEVMPQV